MAELGNIALGLPVVLGLLVGLILLDRSLERRERRQVARATVPTRTPLVSLTGRSSDDGAADARPPARRAAGAVDPTRDVAA